MIEYALQCPLLFYVDQLFSYLSFCLERQYDDYKFGIEDVEYYSHCNEQLDTELWGSIESAADKVVERFLKEKGWNIEVFDMISLPGAEDYEAHDVEVSYKQLLLEANELEEGSEDFEFYSAAAEIFNDYVLKYIEDDEVPSDEEVFIYLISKDGVVGEELERVAKVMGLGDKFYRIVDDKIVLIPFPAIYYTGWNDVVEWLLFSLINIQDLNEVL